MQKGLIINSIVPLRHDPDDRSEMESQLLFGDTFDILQKRNQWRFIRNDFDAYEGWIDEKSFIKISDEQTDQLLSATDFYVADVVAYFKTEDGTKQYLPMGSRLPAYRSDSKSFRLNNDEYFIDTEVCAGRVDDEIFFRLIDRYRHAPYLWGGMTPFGIDCSGLTQMVYKISGRYRLPRNASQQAKHGKRISFDERQPGDLAFFVNDEGHIHHVGIVWFDNGIIHAHGQVRLDDLEPDGIYNKSTGNHTHTLVLIKRL